MISKPVTFTPPLDEAQVIALELLLSDICRNVTALQAQVTALAAAVVYK